MHPALKPPDQTAELDDELLASRGDEGGFGPRAILLVVLVIGLGLGGWA